MLSPNALRALDKVGVYDRLKPLGFNFENSYFRTEDDKLLDIFEFGSAEKYGYSGMRVYRFELIKVLLEMLAEVGLQPVYGKKFTRVISEDADCVTWAFEDGSTMSASLIIGADGIHSRVRSYINQDVSPVFTKMIGVTAAVPTKQLGVNDDYLFPVTIMNKKHGAFVAAPQRKDGSEMFFGKQCHFTKDLDRDGWNRILNDKEWCIDFLRQGQEAYPPLVAGAVSHIDVDKINLWPFYVIPKLKSWVSDGGRVVILGDAAHAIPPTAGQGVNQAFEDVYTFARVLGHFQADCSNDMMGALGKWHNARQARINGVLELNASINKRRLPYESGEEIVGEAFDLRWLYGINFDDFVKNVIG